MSWLSLLHKIVNLFPIRYRLVLDCFTLVKNKKTKSSQCLSNSRNREPTWDWLWARFKILSLFCIIATGLYINMSETWLDPDILPIGPKNVVFWERKKKNNCAGKMTCIAVFDCLCCKLVAHHVATFSSSVLGRNMLHVTSLDHQIKK